MRRLLIAISVVALAAAGVAAAACDDDDDGADASPTPVVSVAASPTVDTDPAIRLDEPVAGATVTIPFTMSGMANVFEAVFHIQVLAPNGRMLCARRMMASSGTGTPADWETMIAFAYPPGVTGSLPARLRVFSLSPKDGAEENIIERTVNVAPEPPNIVIVEPPCNANAPKSAPLVVNGTAEVFEAALTLELRNEFGETVLTKNILSAEGQTRAPFATTLDLSDPAIRPGFYDLVAVSFSAQDGSRENEFAIQIEVVP